MNSYSPLRYPGGKTNIAPLIDLIIRQRTNNINTYIEPFAGGAGVALYLLFNGAVDNIIINDYDKAVYSFWRAIISNPSGFIRKIEDTPVTIEEWHKQKEIYINHKNKYSFELGFATFFLNRTNRSGILNAGPIGGYNQDGKYLIDARFNKDSLIKKINKIALYKGKIKVYNKDIRSFVKNVISENQENSFIYFDPPYYSKGKELYKNYFVPKDHQDIQALLAKDICCPWVLTYDDEFYIQKLYQEFTLKKYELVYSLANKGKHLEIIVFSSSDLCPNEKELEENNIKIKIV